MADLDLTDSTYEFRLNEGNRPTFWPRWKAMKRALWVLATKNGSSWDITTYPGTKSVTMVDVSDADYSWTGGTVRDVAAVDGLVPALQAAGYTVTGSTGYTDTYEEVY